MPEASRLSINFRPAPRRETPSGFSSYNTDAAVYDVQSYIDTLLAIEETTIEWVYSPKGPKGTWGEYSIYDEGADFVRRRRDSLVPRAHRVDPFAHDPVAFFHEYVKDEGRDPVLDKIRASANVAPLLFGTAIEKCLKHLHRVLSLSQEVDVEDIDRTHKKVAHSLGGFFRNPKHFHPDDQEKVAGYWHDLITRWGWNHQCVKRKANGEQVQLNAVNCLYQRLLEIEGLATDRYFFEFNSKYLNHIITPERWALLRAFHDTVSGTIVPFWESRIIHLEEFVKYHNPPPPPEQRIHSEVPDRGGDDWDNICRFCGRQWSRQNIKITTQLVRIEPRNNADTREIC